MNEVNLKTDIQFLKGVGPKLAEKLRKIGIEKVSDLIFHFPRAYKDYTQIYKIEDLINMGNDKFQETNDKQTSNYNFQISNGNKTIKVKVVGVENKRTSRRRFTVTEAVVADDSGSLQVVWFNQPYLKKMLRPGTDLLLNGEVKYNSFSNSYVMESPDRAKKPSIVPVYPETRGISSYYIAKLISKIKYKILKIQEYLPKKILDDYDLMGYAEAVWQMHEPESGQKLAKAKERLAFDELFFVALRARINIEELKKEQAPILRVSEVEMKDFVDSLPFKLTDDQKKAAWQIAQDIGSVQARRRDPSASLGMTDKLTDQQINRSTNPMNRLLNGDVGSGKTVVAAFAIYIAHKAGYKSILMAPTQILANQHFETLKKILEPFGIKIALVTAETKSKRKSTTTDRSRGSNADKVIASETKQSDGLPPTTDAQLIVGTQAILHLKEKIKDVGLVIVDEQHRFGVKQRAKIKELSITNDQLSINNQFENCQSDSIDLSTRMRTQANTANKSLTVKQFSNLDLKPHFLSMTATPIPRTLYLSLFSDLNITRISEMPKGRKKIKTKFVPEEKREEAYKFILKQIEAGRQAFVICPLIEEKGEREKVKESLFDIDKKSVVAEYEKLNEKIFPDLKIGLLHGRLKAKDKETIMSKLSNGKLDILVSTSVVEVGVDVPNASIMMIEDAERFGLAQLHQFRGRVGRGEHQSYCFVFSGSQNPLSVSRLKSFESISDGFELAEIDLKNRGAGQIYGKIQSGHFDFIHADLSDKILVEKARDAAEDIASVIDKYPATKKELEEVENMRHLE